MITQVDLFNISRNTLIKNGKVPDNPEIIIDIMYKVRDNIYKRASYEIPIEFEKVAFWTEMWNKIKPYYTKIPNYFHLKPTAFWGGVGGTLAGGLLGGLAGKSWRSALLGGIGGGIGGGLVGNIYNKPISKYLKKYGL